MKGNKKQREKYMAKMKTKPPHSIGTASTEKVLSVSKKSQVIQRKPEKPGTTQSKLVWVKPENGAKTLTVSKVGTSAKAKMTETNANVTKRGSLVSKSADQVELKKTVATRKSEDEQKSKSPKSKTEIEYKDIICMHCDLHFSTEVWLKKHVARCHSNRLQTEEQQTPAEPKNDTKVDPKMKILNYKKQLEVIQKSLTKNTASEKNKKKSKVSPTKQKLRDQLKAQLAAQQKLLQVQQEIFEKTSKAQQNIFELIAKLGGDSDVESEEEIDDESADTVENIKAEKQNVEAAIENETEMYLDEAGELITSDTVTQYVQLPEEYEDHLVGEEDEYVMLNEQNAEADLVQDDQSLMVIVRSDDGEEEYELVDVVEDPLNESNQIEYIGGEIDFEVVGTDSNSLHCRIVSTDETDQDEEQKQVQLEYVDVQVDQNEKLPMKVDVGQIQQIAQKRINKQLERSKKTKRSDSKLLNMTVNKSEKNTNEYIQKVVQDAVATEDNKFECPICHEMVSNRYSLGPHILRLHSKQKSKICQYCDRSFTCTGDLTRHIRIHTGEKPFKCTHPNCTYAFRASGDLHKHMRRHNSTTINIRQHVCKECDRAFERNYDLKRHELTHKKNEEGVGYTCEFCSKRFVRKDQHKAHVYRHLGIKQYKCPDCDRRFGDFSNCLKHIRQCQAGDVKPFGSDDNDPLFMCEICNKRFKSKVGMKQHVLKCAQITDLQKKLQESFKQMEED